MMFNVRRTDNGTEIPASRKEMIDELARLDPQFDPNGKSDDAVRARYDLAREQAPKTRTDSIDPDVLHAAMKERNANAWKGSQATDARRTDAHERRTDSIDPDEVMRRSRERNANAWKNQ